jgi:signal recognition particle receptor subunit beta
MPSEYKILLVGTMGAGNTTAIAAVSETPPISTDVTNSARHDYDKATTTVAMDYGEVSLPAGDTLQDATAVVGIGRTETHPTLSLDAYYALLATRNLSMPVFVIDVRKRCDVLLLLDVLFHQIEAAVQLDAEAAR